MDKIILGIETSCDDCSVGIVKNGREVLANVISSQIDIHKKFCGVVPEIASRNHIKDISYVVDEALKQANLTFDNIDAIGVTYAPGLEGALLVGLSYGKALAYGLKKDLIPVHHIEGHICANYLESQVKPPFMCLIVSGGHSHLIEVVDYGKYNILGKTLDDAVGEAYDKVARVLGLEYPGGPKIDKLSKVGKETINFPRVFLDKNSLDFSFSGIKSSVLNYVNSKKMKNEEIVLEDVATSFQNAVVEVLVKKTMLALKQTNMKTLCLGGGVASNSGLRKEMEKACKENGIQFFVPKPIYCTDNGVMIASSAYYNYKNGQIADMSLNAVPNLMLGGNNGTN